MDDVGDSYATAESLEKGKSVSSSVQCELDTDVFLFKSGTDDTVRVTIKNKGTDGDPNVEAYACTYKGYTVGTVSVAPGQSLEIDISGMEESSRYYIFVSGSDAVDYTVSYDNITYKITYDLNGGENNSKNPKTYTVGEETKLYAPTKSGNYYFAGWLDDYNYGPYESIEKTTTGNINLHASWINIIPIKPVSLKVSKATKTKLHIYFEAGDAIWGDNIACGISGYVIQVSTSANFKSSKTKSIVVKNAYITEKNVRVKKGKTYYVRVQSYYTYEGTKYYGKYSKVKSYKL